MRLRLEVIDQGTHMVLVSLFRQIGPACLGVATGEGTVHVRQRCAKPFAVENVFAERLQTFARPLECRDGPGVIGIGRTSPGEPAVNVPGENEEQGILRRVGLLPFAPSAA